MFTLIAENQYGEQLELTNNPAYSVINIDGLNPPDAIINSLQRAGHDGSVFNTAFVDNRQIIIDIAINGPACGNRNELFRFFRTARRTRLIYHNDLHDVYIDGWCQNAPVQYFGQKQVFQATLICPDPFWHGLTEVVGQTDGVEALFEFPFSIEEAGIPFSEYVSGGGAFIWNPGNVESGIIVEITASGAVTNPLVYHVNTDTFFKVTTSLQSGDKLIIDTITDEKSVKRIRSGSTTNLIASRAIGSTWLQADPGMNEFTLKADSGVANMTATIRFTTNIEGV